MSWQLLINSLLLSAGVALVSAVLGFVASLWLIGTSGAHRILFLCAAIAVLTLPPFMITNALLELAKDGDSGRALIPLHWLQAILGEPGMPMGLLPTLVVLTFMYWPLTTIALWAAWSRMDPALIESDPLLDGWNFLRHLLYPLGRTALGFSAVLTFVLALNNFSVASVLQARTYPVEVWIRFNTGLDWKGALVASWPMLAAPLLILAWMPGSRIQWSARRARSFQAIAVEQLGRWRWLGAVAAAIGLCISLCFPIAHLVLSSDTWVALPAAADASRASMWRSLFYAVTTAAVCLVLGVVFADTRRMGRFAPAFWVLFFMPGTVLGILIAQAMANTWLGSLRDTLIPILAVLVLKFLALAWAATRMSVESCDPALHDIASLEGATLWDRTIQIYLPQSGSQILFGAYVILLLALWEVECVLPVVPPGGDTLAMRVFNFLHYGHSPEINALCLLLVAMGLAPLVIYLLAHLFLKLSRPRLKGLCTAGLLVTLTGCAGGDREPDTLNSAIFTRVEVIGTKGGGLGQFTKPRSVAVDAEDNLYVADMTGRVQKFSPSGKFLLSWQMPQTDVGRPKGMCRDREGNIVVIEPHYSRVNHFSPSGSFLFQWGRHGTNRGDMAFPRAAVVSDTGNIYVSEYGRFERVQRYGIEKQGTEFRANFEISFGSPGNKQGHFNRPEGLGIDKQGRVFVADSCNHRVQIFDADGNFLSVFGKPGGGSGEVSYPYDVAVDKGGLRFVCEFGNSRIQVFDTNNAALEIIGGPGNAPGRFANPWGIALDSAGNLYVADSQNHRVQKLVRKS